MTKGGADSVIPFSTTPTISLIAHDYAGGGSYSVNVPTGYKRYILIAGGQSGSAPVYASGCGATRLSGGGSYSGYDACFLLTSSGTCTLTGDSSAPWVRYYILLGIK